MKQLITFFFAAAILFVVACGDGDDGAIDSGGECAFFEFAKPSPHAICNFYKSYRLKMSSDAAEDTVSLKLCIVGRTLDDIHELIDQDPYAGVCEFDMCESYAEIEHYCRMFNDTCFNAAGFGINSTLDTIACISVVCQSSDAGMPTAVDGNAVIEYNDIKKIVGVHDLEGGRVSVSDFDWSVKEPLGDFNSQTDNYLVDVNGLSIKVPAPKVPGGYYYTLTYTCTNGREFVLRDTVVVE